MNYRAEDIERIYRVAISSVVWAKDHAARLWSNPDPTEDSILSALVCMDDAIYNLERARDEWREQLNKEEHGRRNCDRSAGREEAGEAGSGSEGSVRLYAPGRPGDA